MIKSKHNLIAALCILLTLAACNLPTGPSNSGPSASDQAATIVAATLQAGTSSAASQTTPFASPAAPAVTPTTAPTLLINANNASCRNGPSADFKVVATFAAGTTVNMAGKDSADGYWIVVDPGSHSLCWVQQQDGTPAGSFASLPEMTPQASSPKAPTGPGFVNWQFSCVYSSSSPQVSVTLSWTDKADNENGYRIFRNGTQIADLPANSTSYSDTTNIPAGTTIVYGVVAYNDAGSSSPATTPQTHTAAGDPITCQ